MTMTTRTMARTMTMFTSSHLLIFTSSPLGLLPSCPLLHIFSSSHPHIFVTSSHLHIFSSRPLAFSFFSRKLASASWSLLALASIPGAAQGHEDVKMWRWEDVKMRRCEDEQMWRWEDVKMRRCEDEQMWRWEDERQTPTIGRTLHSDALGNENLHAVDLEVETAQAPQVRSTFGSWDVEKVHVVLARSTFRSQQHVKNTRCSDHFWKLWCWKSEHRCGVKRVSKSKVLNSDCLWPILNTFGLLDVQMSCRVAGARDSAPSQKWAKPEGLVAASKTWASVGHLQRICKDVIFVESAGQETHEPEMLGGLGADFLRAVAFWSIRSSGLLR